MKKYYENKDYMNIVEDILNNKEIQRLKEYKHHGINRLTHSINVSYNSYKIAKLLKLNYKASARAGLLHDFFFVNNQKIKFKERIKILFKHPVIALENSKKFFELAKTEEDIILSHMFPLVLKIPKYKESWIVDLIDDISSINERIYSVFHKNS